LTGGMVSRWGLDKAVLAVCASGICRLVLAAAVRDEVEENLLIHAASLDAATSNQLLKDYDGLLKLTRPLIVPYPPESEIIAARSLIRHSADVPVLVSAIKSKPDWLLTHNTKHFSQAVARRTGLRIGTPADFFTALSQGTAASSGVWKK